MTYTHTDVRLCVQAIRAYFIFLFLPMFFVIFVICATSRSNMFVFRCSLLCSLFHPSTIFKFCQFVLSKSKNAKVFLTPFRGHNFSPKLTPYLAYKPPRGRLPKVLFRHLEPQQCYLFYFCGIFTLNLKCLSLNARGLNKSIKRRSIFRWLHKQNKDVILLQETYSSKETAKIWETE